VETHLTNVKLLNNIAIDNSRPNNGGGIYKSSQAGSYPDLFIDGGSISGNEADQGGGIYLSRQSKLTMSGGSVTNNLARNGVPGSGGGIWCAELAVDDVMISGSNVTANTPDDISCIPDPSLTKIIVKKLTEPDTSIESFEFTTNFGESFLLGHGELHDSGPLSPTSENEGIPYAIIENVPDGWTLQNASCSDDSDPGSIELSLGEVVTCTFQNLHGADMIFRNSFE
jgi:hypothetical protein